MSDNERLDEDSGQQLQSTQKTRRPSAISEMMNSPGAKFVIVGILAALLLVPALLIWALIEERAGRERDVSMRISQGWGGEQAVNGPYLAVPFTVSRQVQEGTTTTTVERTEWALLSPDELDTDVRLQVETRRLSIYSLPVYNAGLLITGRFSSELMTKLDGLAGTPHLDRAFLVMNITDIIGIRSNGGIRINGGTSQIFEPGMRGLKSPSPLFSYNPNYNQEYGYRRGQSTSGINRPVDRGLLETGFSFAIELSLNGSGRFAVAPAGQMTKLSINADWPHPGFDGRFLPERKEISEQGFSADWSIPYLARGTDRIIETQELPLSDNLMTVNLVEPVKLYQMVSRTLKYSIGFIALMYFAVLVIEIKGGGRVHWVQYVIAGIALLVFYILLLALCEHIGFGISYAVATVATTAIIALYLVAITSNWRNGLALAVLLGLSYGVLYLVLREDEYALLAGAAISFIIVAVTMYFTRNIDWSGGAKSL